MYMVEYYTIFHQACSDTPNNSSDFSMRMNDVKFSLNDNPSNICDCFCIGDRANMVDQAWQETADKAWEWLAEYEYDPETIEDKATYNDPHQYPEGIPYVIVNGQVVIEEGEHSGALPGRILRNRE